MKSEKLLSAKTARRRIATKALHINSAPDCRPYRAREWAKTGLTYKKRLPGLQVCQFLPGRSAHDQRNRIQSFWLCQTALLWGIPERGPDDPPEGS
jgi:hypothetical protein